MTRHPTRLARPTRTRSLSLAFEFDDLEHAVTAALVLAKAGRNVQLDEADAKHVPGAVVASSRWSRTACAVCVAR